MERSSVGEFRFESDSAKCLTLTDSAIMAWIIEHDDTILLWSLWTVRVIKWQSLA
jgi:hypothetical protein